MMKLHVSGNSPYARRVRVAIRACGLTDQVEEVAIKSFADLPTESPGNKVPVLVVEPGLAISECLLISRYLDGLAGGILSPTDPRAQIEQLEIESVASVLMDSLFARSMEKNQRDEATRSDAVLEKEANRSARCYDRLNVLLEGASLDVNLASIAVVSCLGYADWRNPEDEWRQNSPALVAWFDQMMELPAFADTAPVY